MKKAFISFACVLASLIIVLNIFSEQIGNLVAESLYKDKISVYSPSDKTEAVKLRKNDYLYFGKFGGENILWKVIAVNDNGEPLLLSEKAICFMPFNSGIKAVAGSSSWETSSIRSWLNSDSEEEFIFECNPENRIKNNQLRFDGGFLSPDNFSAAEAEAIRDGKDRIILPSRAMLSGIKPDQRKKAPTSAAVINDGSSYIQFRTACWYWASDPINTNTSSVSSVTPSGYISKCISNDGLMGVCPAVYLKSCSISSCGGDGSIGTPYIFTAEVTG